MNSHLKFIVFCSLIWTVMEASSSKLSNRRRANVTLNARDQDGDSDDYEEYSDSNSTEKVDRGGTDTYHSAIMRIELENITYTGAFVADLTGTKAIVTDVNIEDTGNITICNYMEDECSDQIRVVAVHKTEGPYKWVEVTISVDDPLHDFDPKKFIDQSDFRQTNSCVEAGTHHEKPKELQIGGGLDFEDRDCNHFDILVCDSKIFGVLPSITEDNHVLQSIEAVLMSIDDMVNTRRNNFEDYGDVPQNDEKQRPAEKMKEEGIKKRKTSDSIKHTASMFLLLAVLGII